MITTNPYTMYGTQMIAQIDGSIVTLPTAMVDDEEYRKYDHMYKDNYMGAYDKVKDPWAVDTSVHGPFLEIGGLSINMNEIKSMEYSCSGLSEDDLKIWISDQIHYNFNVHGVRNFREIKKMVYNYFEQKDKPKYYE